MKSVESTFYRARVANADYHAWITEFDRLSKWGNTPLGRERFTVHLNDNGTTTLYYTGV